MGLGMFLTDEKTSALLKAATVFADAGDWSNAIETCKQAKQSIIQSPVNYPTVSLCKLGLYYSRAGHVDEAISELNSLFELIPIIQRRFYCSAKSHPAPMPEDLLIASCFTHYKTVYESLKTVYKRAKLYQLADMQDDQIENCQKQHDRFNKKYEKWVSGIKNTALKTDNLAR